MGKKDHGPSPLERALQGDGEAQEHVLGGVVAPLFDLALHLEGDPARAEATTLSALTSLAHALQSGTLENPDPLLVASRWLIANSPHSTLGPKHEPPLTFSPRLLELTTTERLALLVSLAIDAEGEDLSYVLGVSREESSRALVAARRRLSLSDSELRDAMDFYSAETPLPRNLVERALQLED